VTVMTFKKDCIRDGNKWMSDASMQQDAEI
jgi:hypothetical protein